MNSVYDGAWSRDHDGQSEYHQFRWSGGFPADTILIVGTIRPEGGRRGRSRSDVCRTGLLLRGETIDRRVNNGRIGGTGDPRGDYGVRKLCLGGRRHSALETTHCEDVQVQGGTSIQVDDFVKGPQPQVQHLVVVEPTNRHDLKLGVDLGVSRGAQWRFPGIPLQCKFSNVTQDNVKI